MTRDLGRKSGVRRLSGAVVLLVLLGPLAGCQDDASHAGASSSPTAAPVQCAEPSPLDVPGDVNHDEAADYAVGNPERGEVVVTFVGNGTQRITAKDLDPSGPSTTGDQFGAAVAVGDIVGADTCGDLAVSAPRRAGPGVVYVAPGGWSTVDARVLGPHTQIIRGQSDGERFGAAIAVSPGALWIGAPGRTVNGFAGAGAVDEYSLSTGRPRLVATITQATPSVQARPDAGDGFGAVLAANARGVLIGTPGDNVLSANGVAVDAGSVTFYDDPSAPGAYPTHTWTQNSPAPDGRAQAGARFGISVATSPDGRALLVGAPGRDIDRLEDAGQVQLFVAASGDYRPEAPISQATAGVPGTAEGGDEFGAAVALGAELLCPRSLDAAIGSPGEDIDGDEDAGSVTMVSVLGDHCPAQAVQARYRPTAGGFSALADDFANPGDRLGAALGVLRRAATADRPERDSLLIGAPGLDILGANLPDKYQALAPVVDSGAVIIQTLRTSISGRSLVRLTFDGPAAGIHYGGVISAAPS